MLPDTEAIRKAKETWYNIGLITAMSFGVLLALFLSYEICTLVDEVLNEDKYNITTGCRYDYILDDDLCYSRDRKTMEPTLVCSGHMMIDHLFCICKYVIYVATALFLVIALAKFSLVTIVNPLLDIYHHFNKDVTISSTSELNIQQYQSS